MMALSKPLSWSLVFTSTGRLKAHKLSGLNAGQLAATKQELHWRKEEDVVSRIGTSLIRSLPLSSLSITVFVVTENTGKVRVSEGSLYMILVL
jgi:hypothetical protein